MLTSGELHIGKNAQVGKDVVLTSGDLYLADGAVVHGDVILSSEDIKVQQDPGIAGGRKDHLQYRPIRDFGWHQEPCFCTVCFRSFCSSP